MVPSHGAFTVEVLSQAGRVLTLKDEVMGSQAGTDAAPGAKARKYVPVHSLGSGSRLFPSCVTPGETKAQWEKI